MELQNLIREQNQPVKKLVGENDHHTQAILNIQSTNNELEQQVTSLKRVNLENFHSLEKL